MRTCAEPNLSFASKALQGFDFNYLQHRDGQLIRGFAEHDVDLSISLDALVRAKLPVFFPGFLLPLHSCMRLNAPRLGQGMT